MNKIRIEGDGMPRNTRVFLDDMDISRFVRNIHIDIGAGKAPIVNLECFGFLRMSDEIKAVIKILITSSEFERMRERIRELETLVIGPHE